MQAELQARDGSIGVRGALHGELSALDPESLTDLCDLGLSSNSEIFNELATLGTEDMQYMPWMQTSYIVATNRKALDDLPEGANVDALSDDKPVERAAAVHEGEGKPLFDYPAGPRGTKHRFFQGYLHPSYSNGVVRSFASPEAETAWESFWSPREHTNPASTNYAFMREQLLSEDVWIAFDHRSQLAQAGQPIPRVLEDQKRRLSASMEERARPAGRPTRRPTDLALARDPDRHRPNDISRALRSPGPPRYCRNDAMSARTLPDVLILPVTLIPGLFFPYPFVLVAELAFTSDEGWSMENFREGVSYWKFPISMRNTLLLAAIVVPIQLSLPLLMVTMFGRMGKGRDLVLLYGPSRRASWTLPPASSGWRSSSGRAFSTP